MIRDFTARVNYAARVISDRRPTSRRFNSCFENGDGDEVVAALRRRALRNPRLAANLRKYLVWDDAA